MVSLGTDWVLEAHGAVVRLQCCSQDSPHSLRGSGSQLEFDATFHLSKVGELNAELAGQGAGVACIIKL